MVDIGPSLGFGLQGSNFSLINRIFFGGYFRSTKNSIVPESFIPFLTMALSSYNFGPAFMPRSYLYTYNHLIKDILLSAHALQHHVITA